MVHTTYYPRGSLLFCQICADAPLNPLEQTLAEALCACLNVEGAAMRGGSKGLDVRWHFDKVREALAHIGRDPIGSVIHGEAEPLPEEPDFRGGIAWERMNGGRVS